MKTLRCSFLLVLLSAIFVQQSKSQESIADVVKRSSDSVVLIATSNSEGQETALGSGFLVSPDGQIVTNNHVIEGASSAIVKLSNGAFFPVVRVLASASDNDLAIIKVNGKNLPFLSLAGINRVRVGDHVVAIGSPLGLEGTVSDGIVSAIRDDGGKRWIQTTAPISPGNSGGPLLDMSDHVVGVITWGVKRELGENLNFAAPSDEVASLLVAARQQAKPPDSVANADSFSAGKLWTSLNTGHDFNLRRDGDYLYVDVANIPAEFKAAGAFVRTELKKGPDGKWTGKTRGRMPCKYKVGYGADARDAINWCSREADMKIVSLSESRIEGISTIPEKFDCGKCEPQGKMVEHPFTWIPK